MNNTTLKKIAESMGCSISTVSRALKHHPDISVKTREKVLELATALDYEPNAFAVHLRTKHSKLIGLLVPAISNHFYESFIASVEEESRKNGYSLMILQSANDPDIESDNLRLFRQNRVTGLFACITADTKELRHYNKMKELDIPVVFVDNVPDEKGLNKVCLADERAASLAAEAITRAKKIKILAFFGDPKLSITQRRKEAFERYIHKFNKEASIEMVFAKNSAEAETDMREALEKKKKPDAVFCMSDELLIGVMKSIHQKQIMIPRELGVIAISNGFIPSLYYPAITYVETSGHKLGKLAFTQLMACLSGQPSLQELFVESILVEGGSL
jgi:LacI family transcriptional regulator